MSKIEGASVVCPSWRRACGGAVAGGLYHAAALRHDDLIGGPAPKKLGIGITRMVTRMPGPGVRAVGDGTGLPPYDTGH